MKCIKNQISLVQNISTKKQQNLTKKVTKKIQLLNILFI